MLNRSSQWRLLACSAVMTGLVLLTAAGCSSGTQTATVSGKVLYKDSVVPGGTITFKTDKEVNKQSTFSGAIDGEGHYRVVGLPVDCTAKVAVETLSAKVAAAGGAPGPPRDIGKMKAVDKMPTSSGKKYREIPAKYSTPETSGVTVKITKTVQEEDIKLP